MQTVLKSLAAVPLVLGLTAGAAEATSPTLRSSDLALEAALAYQQTVDADWVGPTIAGNYRRHMQRGATTPTTAYQEISKSVRDGLHTEGVDIVKADSTIETSSISHTDDGLAVIIADITTRFEYSPEDTGGIPGYWTDRHKITVDTSGPEPRVVDDQIVPPPSDEGIDLPPSFLSSPSSSDRTEQERFKTSYQPAPSPALRSNSKNMTLDFYYAQGYSLTWTQPPYARDEEKHFNPDYPYFKVNCANFVSQILAAGGWEYDGGVNPFDTDNWSPNLTGLAGPSRTWSSSA